jgi:D-alanyl-D-alanine carboxypeptidase
LKRKVFVTLGCIILSAFFLTGCAGLHKLDNPYEFSERTALYQSASMAGKSETFAHDLCVVSKDTADSDNSVTAEAAAVFGLSGNTVIFAKNPFEKLYPASITKTMTALLAVKYGTLTDEVTVPKDAVIKESGASLCGIKPGDKLTMEQLLYGLMLPSGNDAGVAIAVNMAGSVDQFAQMMNDEAKKLGATGTHFVNPHGLSDEDHYTTAYDLYLIFNEALKYPEFRKIIGTAEYKTSYQGSNGKNVNATWKGTNWYMTGERKTPDGLTVLGGKTGTTLSAGSCLIMGSSDASKKEYISVVLKARDHAGLYDNMSNILDKIVE